MKLCASKSVTQIDCFLWCNLWIAYPWIHLDTQGVEMDYYVREAVTGMDRVTWVICS